MTTPRRRSTRLLDTPPVIVTPTSSHLNDDGDVMKPGPDPAPSSSAATATPTRKRKSSKSTKQQRLSSQVIVSPSPAKKPKKRSSTTKTKSNTSSQVGKDKLTSEQVAAILPEQPFLDLNIPPEELRPSATVTNGQCFHWTALETTNTRSGSSEVTSAWGTHDATEWIGTLRTPSGHSLVIVLKETPTTVLYRPLTPLPDEDDDFNLQHFLWEYFQLGDCLQDLYQEWSQADERLATIAKCIPGARLINQDPFECLVSFICSSNNNIPRITQMVNAIRREYGQCLLTIGDHSFYSFPTLEELSKATDAEFRNNCGLGYRSKYLLTTMQILQSHGGESYLHELKNGNHHSPDQVQEKLCEFHGVGRKVADCVSLFSLKQDSAIPVDVHVWQIAVRDYDTDNILKEAKSLTPTIYQHVVDMFRTRFPNKAGWAHSLLFLAELPSFRAVLPTEMVEEMDQFKLSETKRKQELADAKKKRVKQEN
jgi:N-glycosylase/DNA lyase